MTATAVRPLDALKAEVRALLERITEDAVGFIELASDSPRGDFSKDAQDLRDASSRLDEIVRGVTAVHVL